MATTVAQLQVEVESLRAELATLRGELEASIPMLQKLLAEAIEQMKAQITTSRPASPKRADEAKVFPSPKDAMEACKAAVARRDGRRYWVVGDTLWNAAR